MRRLAILFLFVATTAHGSSWFTNGPEGGRVNALALDPVSGRFYAGTDNGLFVSNNISPDFLEPWTRIHNVDDYEVTHVAIDPTSPSIVYAAYGQVESYFLLSFRASKLFRSADGGATWSEVTAFGASKSISSLELDAAGNVYIGFRCGIETFKGAPECVACATDVRTDTPVRTAARSTDHGVTWQLVTGTPADRFRCIRSMTPDSELPGIVYAHSWNLTGSFVIDNWRSTDGGQTFTKSTAPNPPGKNLLIHPATKRRYAVNGGGTASDFGLDPSSIVVSDDAGATWRQTPLPVQPPQQGSIVAAIAIDAAGSPDTMYAATDSGLYRTTNLGATWEALFREATYAIVLTPARVYIGTAVGLAVSRDLGRTWSVSEIDDAATTAIEIEADPSNPSTAYAWIEDYEQRMSIARTTDAGATWQRLTSSFAGVKTNGFPQPIRPRLGVDGDGAAYVLQDTVTVARLRAGELTWQRLPYPDPFPTLLLADPKASGTLYVVNGDAKLRKSTDGGSSWSDPIALSNTFATAAAIDPVDPRILFVGTSSGVQRTTDGGATWTTVNPNRVSGLSVSRADHRVVWAFTCCTLLERSTDGGATWHRTAIPNINARGVAADAKGPNVVYVWAIGEGVYRSTDGGATWSPFNDGLTTGDINWVAAAPDGHALYAATFRRGVFTKLLQRVRAARPPR